MRVRRILVGGMLILVIAAAAAVLQARLYFKRSAEDELRKGEDIQIAGVRPPLPANAFLACPRGRCSAAAAETPVYSVPVDLLAACFMAAISREPYLRLVGDIPAARRLVFIQHSLIFQFPDVITVELIEFGGDHSGVAIYSRSRYGDYDFGVNRRRVGRWLAQLDRIVATMQSRYGAAQYNPPVPTPGPASRAGAP